MSWLRHGNRRAGRLPSALLLVLSLLWSLGPIRADLLPGLVPVGLPPLERQGLAFAMLALVATLLALARRAPWPEMGSLRDAAVIGLGLFVVPALLVWWASDAVPELTRVALFSLAPVFAVVFEPYLGGNDGSQSSGGLMAALVAVAGTLCLFPLALPQSVEAAGGVCAVIFAVGCAAAANCRAVTVARRAPGTSTLPMVAIAGGVSAAALLIAGALAERTHWRWTISGIEGAWIAAVDLPALLLLFWLMPRMTALRMTTRYVLAPLMAIVIEIVLLRPGLGLRGWVGVLLSAGGAGWLLFAPQEPTDMPSIRLYEDRD